jgi:hypothetical protein
MCMLQSAVVLALRTLGGQAAHTVQGLQELQGPLLQHVCTAGDAPVQVLRREVLPGLLGIPLDFFQMRRMWRHDLPKLLGGSWYQWIGMQALRGRFPV